MKFFLLFSFLLIACTNYLPAQTTLVEWNFPNDPDNAVADGGIPANAAKIISTVGTSVLSFAAVGATTNSASATIWAAGAGTKYWMVEVQTTGYNTITLSSKQRSTNTGPRDFIAEYRIGAAGAWTVIPGSAVVTADNYTSGILTNIALPAACNNQASVFIRWIMNSNTAVGGMPVTGAGVSNIDDIRIRGILIAGTTLPTDYFRSAQSGIWDNVSSWESSPDNTAWVASSLIPTSAANAIIIRSPHIITLNADASADQLTINQGATLHHNNAIVFTLSDGAGDDMTINGTYNINGTMPAGTGTVLVDGLNASVFALTNTGGESDDFAASTRVTFRSGTSFYWQNITAFNTSGVTYFPNSGPNDRPRFVIASPVGASVGGATQTIINGYLDVRANITFNNTGTKIFRDGIFTLTPAVLTQTATCGQLILNGAFPNIGGSGIINLGNNGLQIPAGSQALLINNQQINNSTVTVNGDLFAYEYQITGTTNFNLAGNLYTQHANGISLTGTLANTGTKTLGAASAIIYDRLTAMGGDQQFTSRNDYANVQISGGSRKVLNGSAVMSGTLVLNNGLVVTTATNLLTITSAGSTFGVNNNSFVTGPLRKIGNTGFLFPVGKLVGGVPHIRAISISAPDNVADEFTGEFIRSNARVLGSGTITASGLQRVSQCEFWTLNHVNAGTPTSVNVTLIWTAQSPCNVTYVTEPSTVVVAHHDGVSWDSYGGSGIGAPSPGSGSVTWNGVTTFSPFALGSTSVAENPLPFELSSFTAKLNGEKVQIAWQINNNTDYKLYEVEKSTDGNTYTTLTEINAKPSLTDASYGAEDKTPAYGWNYYRLRAKDPQGRANISGVERVWYGQKPQITVSPNPAAEKITIYLPQPSSIFTIQLVNSTGYVVKQTNNIQFFNEINISHLQAGMYYIRVIGKNGVTVTNFVKQ